MAHEESQGNANLKPFVKNRTWRFAKNGIKNKKNEVKRINQHLHSEQDSMVQECGPCQNSSIIAMVFVKKNLRMITNEKSAKENEIVFITNIFLKNNSIQINNGNWARNGQRLPNDLREFLPFHHAYSFYNLAPYTDHQYSIFPVFRKSQHWFSFARPFLRGL